MSASPAIRRRPTRLGPQYCTAQQIKFYAHCWLSHRGVCRVPQDSHEYSPVIAINHEITNKIEMIMRDNSTIGNMVLRGAMTGARRG